MFRMPRGFSLGLRLRRPSQRACEWRRWYHFASPSYANSFGDFPAVDVAKLRQDTVKHLDSFQAETWFQDPVCTVIRGGVLKEGEVCETVDAFGKVNGKQILATPEVVDKVLEQVQRPSAGKDFRAAMRSIEARLLSEHAAFLIGNQALDFHKQDGVTEIEESIEANVIERKLNDLLLADELSGKVRIQRHTALVGCVSNFSNFLDLCRKTLRNVELGVPVLVLSRSNTTQHMYRWFQLLQAEMEKEGVDLSLVTYLSCSIQEQRRVMSAMAQSPLYLTGSRPVAAAIKELMPFTFASTGGPNTMVAPKLDAPIEAAVRMSSTIENSGQCTAMRHLVTDDPNFSEADLAQVFAPAQATDSAAESLRRGAFDGLFRSWAEGFQAEEGYQVLQANGAQPPAFRISKGLSPQNLEEHWRRVYLDVSTPKQGSVKDPAYLQGLAKWLTHEQPITLAVNGDDEEAGFPIMRQLFETTAQAIYSVGRQGQPALTAQARPQDGEIFGEFPPRAEMQRYTCGPVFVPSSTPSYMARYEAAHLRGAAERLPALNLGWLEELPLEARGYAVLMVEYLKESCGAKRGCGSRTSLWGLQRPPLWPVSTLLRARATDDFAAVALHLLPFLTTNAKEGLVVSVAADCSSDMKSALRAACQHSAVPCHEEEESAFQRRRQESEPWNTVFADAKPSAEELPMVDHFVLRLLPMGHIKSACPKDEDFVKVFQDSPKWLRFG